MNPEDILESVPRLMASSNPESENVKPTQPALSDQAAPSEKAKPPLFIHEQEFREAQRVVTLIASGRNPFSNEPFEKLRPEHRDIVLQGLCVISTYLSDQKSVWEKSHSASSANPDPSDPSTKRPLEQYLDRLERQAIIEALAENHYNRTAAARCLGISFRALRYRMERLGLSDSEVPGQ